MPRRVRVAVGVVVLAVAVASCTADRPEVDRASPATPSTAPPSTATASAPSAGSGCGGTDSVTRAVAQYRSGADGADTAGPADLTTLEVIRPDLPEGCGPTPVMVWVHGGGWTTGDRRNQLDDKVALFASMGWTLVSVNYRLSPQVQYPVHNDDVAAAIDWVLDRAPQLGLDPERVSVMGHSAGAGIVAGVVADPDHLGAVGRSPSELACAVLLDTEGYDVVAQAEDANPIYLTAFGDDPQVWRAASPLQQLRDRTAASATGGTPTALPEVLVVTRGVAARRSTAASFVEALRDAEADAELLDARPLNHAEVNAAIGAPGDRVVTPALVELLRGC